MRTVLDWIKRTLFTLFIGLLFVYVCVVAYWLWWPYNPIRIDEVKVDKDIVATGERICFQIAGEKFMPVQVKVIVELVNGESMHIVSYDSNVPVGDKFIPRCFIVPYSIIPRQYQIRWTGGYQVNMLRVVTKRALSKWITIVDGLEQGRRGEAGKTGEKGDKGDKGEKGGISIFGRGETGERGPRGFPGK